jgi:acetyl-CoA C-acetyltransferase
MGNSRVAIVGIHEYESRDTRGTMTPLNIKAHCAARALEDAGLGWSDIDALYDDGDGIIWPGLHMSEYFDLDLRVIDTTTVGGSSFEFHVSHALDDLGSGRAKVALLTYGAVARSSNANTGTGAKYSELGPPNPISNMEDCWGPTLVSDYAQFARRYMHDHGTSSEQLAEIAVTARSHALRNPEAVQAIEDLGLRPGPREITVDDVLSSRMIADPLRVLDCCVISDGGGAVVLAAEDVARNCRHAPVWVLGAGEALRHRRNGDDLTVTGAAFSGPTAFGRAGVTPGDIDVAMIYDSFTITVLATLEDLGFCAKGEGGSLVENGGLRFDTPGLAVNTDGGGLSSNHPGQRGIFLLIEAARQLRGQSTAQVPGAELALAHGTGGTLNRRYASGTVILGRDR